MGAPSEPVARFLSEAARDLRRVAEAFAAVDPSAVVFLAAGASMLETGIGGGTPAPTPPGHATSDTARSVLTGSAYVCRIRAGMLRMPAEEFADRALGERDAAARFFEAAAATLEQGAGVFERDQHGHHVRVERVAEALEQFLAALLATKQ